MALFRVTNIINGSTIEVNGWVWSGYQGSKVKIAGFNIAPNSAFDNFARGKLQNLLTNKSVELLNVINVETITGENIIQCSVFLDNIDISQYFPELRTPA